MYKIKEQNLTKKATPAEYTKYNRVKHLLLEYNKSKEDVKGLMNVERAGHEMTTWLKNFRYQQKESRTSYVVESTVDKKWAKLIGPTIKYEFEVTAPIDSTIVKNARHHFIHKSLLKIEAGMTKLEQLKVFKDKIREKYRAGRKAARQLRVHQRSKTIRSLGVNVRYEICGGVMHQRIKPVFGRGVSPKGYKSPEMGAFMRMLKSKDKQIVFEEKKPQTKDNYLGVEIEFLCDLNQEDLSFKLYEAGLGKNVCLKGDGSIKQDSESTGMYTHEVCLLAKEKEMAAVVESVSKILLSANAKVNKTCGLHVHLDMRSRDHVVAFHNLVSAQNVLFAMNPFSRQSGTYCKRQETKVFKEAAGNGTRDMRYFGINATAHAKHNTIEVRIHSGTVQADKINKWIDLLLAITNKKEAIKRAPSSLKSFIKQFEVEAKLGIYIAERMAKFVGEDKKDAEERGAA
jgi:hypothetical protein